MSPMPPVGPNAKYFEDFKVGDKFQTQGRTFTAADGLFWSMYSGDMNPMHVDNEFAKQYGIFGGLFPPGLAVVGIASGLALLFEGDDYIGTAVNLAARLCDAAASYEVIIPVDQIENLPEGVVAVPHEPLTLRGLNEAINVVTLTGEATDVARNDTGELWTRSPFVM